MQLVINTQCQFLILFVSKIWQQIVYEILPTQYWQITIQNIYFIYLKRKTSTELDLLIVVHWQLLFLSALEYGW